MMRDGGNGYWYTELGCNYGGIAQRWLVVHSDRVLNRDLTHSFMVRPKTFCLKFLCVILARVTGSTVVP